MSSRGPSGYRYTSVASRLSLSACPAWPALHAHSTASSSVFRLGRAALSRIASYTSIARAAPTDSASLHARMTA